MMTPGKLIKDLERITLECYDNDKAYVEAKNAYHSWEDLKKVKFEMIIDLYEGKKSEKEHMALMSEKWKNYLYRLSELRYDHLVAMTERDRTCREWDYIRSSLSMIKQEVNKGL